MDFSSTTVKKYIFKEILAQNRTRTIVFIVIGVYLYHFQELGATLKSTNVFVSLIQSVQEKVHLSGTDSGLVPN